MQTSDIGLIGCRRKFAALICRRSSRDQLAFAFLPTLACFHSDPFKRENPDTLRLATEYGRHRGRSAKVARAEVQYCDRRNPIGRSAGRHYQGLCRLLTKKVYDILREIQGKSTLLH